ncbi:type VII secretion-associated serine protease mycosin [Streptomyces sp. XM4193]|uniref:type VII secretion-associated serine protease mycosin n=1 Tax=Streptomyces sp. XM4193 TaxID=2929782 RepID=UPI001FF8264A|nr:type VII secretion-associated serine protease mycosin [Streptomyces sp. XM4193]MCK1797191.1 type VII secretion-associated serine protease mycosin [Streptomyces sp. XM4193]
MRRRTLASLALAGLVLAGPAAAPATPAGAYASSGQQASALSSGHDAAGERTAARHPAPLALSDAGECRFGGKQFPGRPWPLQRVQLDRLWQESRGKGIRVAVIDSGVDAKNPQLAGAVDRKAGKDLLKPGKNEPKGAPRGPTVDNVGHGTKVAGIIAARPRAKTGFAGLAPEATVVPIRQNDGQGEGDVDSLVRAIDYAIAAGVHVINISQDAKGPLHEDSQLPGAVQRALDRDIVVIASAGNDGASGKSVNTYPAALPGVLAVAASDRNNERAYFSQRGEFVGVAAPGVDVVSTVPLGGHCVDNGTSFAAPFVAGVAALIREKHPTWTHQQVVAQIQQTAERAVSGRDRHIGWGVVDPVRALTEDSSPVDRPVAREGVRQAEKPEAAALNLHETYAERNERLATYVLLAVLVLVGLIATAARILRDRARGGASAGASDAT